MQNLWVLKIENTFVTVFREQRVENGAGLRAILCKDVALAHLLDAFAPGERGLVKATWQIRSKGSRSLPTSSRSGSRGRPSLSSSSIIACLRSAPFQRRRKASRLVKRFFSALLVKSRRLSVTNLPFSSRYSTR